MKEKLNVIMIHIKMNGLLKLLMIFNLILIISCSSTNRLNQEIIKRNYHISDELFNAYIYNDSIKVDFDFWGSIDIENLSKTKNHKIRREFRRCGINNIKNLTIDKLFLSFNSTSNNYKFFFFYDKLNPTNDTTIYERIIMKDTINDITIIEKQKKDTKITVLVKGYENDLIFTNNIIKGAFSKMDIGLFNKKKLSYFKIFQSSTNGNHNYLQARENLKSAPLEDKKYKEINSLKTEFIATSNSFLSNNPEYNSFLLDYEKKRKAYFNETIKKIYQNNDVFKNNKIFDEISLVAKNNSVIMLNEDHYYPKHRLFAMQLLDVLKQNGYNYLSLEAFSNDKKNNLFPNHNNGFYTSEPYFGHFLRRAKELGFTILGHENQDDSVDREIGQAKNIYKILQDDPKAKIFVYVGKSHLEKSSRGKKWMAEYFKEISKVNPITINQARIFADTNDEIVLIPKNYFINDTIIKSSADYFLINNIKVDLKKVYPNSKFESVTLKGKEIKKYKNNELLIEVFNFYEYEKLKSLTLPIVNLLSKPKSNSIKVYLPIGKYLIKIKTSENNKILEKTVLLTDE